MNRNPLVTPEWLYEHLKDPDLVVVDCRFDLTRPQSGKEGYRRNHIPGALYLDLEKDLSAPVGIHGGRHPLPDVDRFADRLGEVGIDRRRTVVAYDDQGGAMAARLWWMLRCLGHEAVFVLNGGYTAWTEMGYPVNDEVPRPEPTRFVPNPNRDLLVGMEEVKAWDGLLIDSREPARYEGKAEPIDAKAGHIPGAVNRFWKENLGEDGRWKNPAEMKKNGPSLWENKPLSIADPVSLPVPIYLPFTPPESQTPVFTQAAGATGSVTNRIRWRREKKITSATD